jgi:hypothetical protein
MGNALGTRRLSQRPHGLAFLLRVAMMVLVDRSLDGPIVLCAAIVVPYST